MCKSTAGYAFQCKQYNRKSNLWCMQTRQQSICVRHEDVVDNTTTWLVDFQEQFGLATKPGFPIEVSHSTAHVPQAMYGYETG